MLRRIREERKIDAMEVAAAIGVTADAVRRWERGQTPRLRHQRALQEYFQIPADVLLSREEDVDQEELNLGGGA